MILNTTLKVKLTGNSSLKASEKCTLCISMATDTMTVYVVLGVALSLDRMLLTDDDALILLTLS